MILFLPPLTFLASPFSVSLSLSLFFALVFLSSFLSFFFGFLFVSCFCLFFHCSFFFAFVSSIEQHEHIKLQFLLFINMFFFFGCLSCFLFEISFLIFVFSRFELCFLFNIIVFGFKKPKLKNTNFWSKGGLQHNGFFMNLCFAKCEKLSFLVFFFGKFWVAFKKHYKSRHFSTFFNAKIYKRKGIFECYYLVHVDCYYLVQVGCVLKNANLDQIITFKLLARNFFFKKKGLKPLFL